MMETQKIPEGYKQTEVGVIPEDWKATILGDIAEVRMCKRILAGQTKKTGTIPFFKIGTFGSQPDAYIPDFLYREYKTKYSFPNKGDILISAAGTLGKTVIYDGKPAYFQDSNIVWLEINKSELLNEYLNHYYKVIKWASSEGSTIARLYNGIILASPIIVPPLQEQTAIAKALSDVDALITGLESLIAKKSAIKTAAMQQLLTGKKRLPGFGGQQQTESDGVAIPYSTQSTNSTTNNAPRPGYKNTELGEIPEDWEVVTIESISSVPMQNGLFYEPERKGKGVSLINVGDLYKSAPIDIDSLELFEANNSEIKTFRISNGDLFFTRSSIVPSGIAYCNIYDSDDADRDVVFDSHLIRVRVNVMKADAKYVYLACISNLARKFLISSAKTATMTTIDQGAIKQCPILLPTKKEQTAIATVLSDMDIELDALQQRLNKTQQIKQGMMQELLTGKTRLPVEDNDLKGMEA